MSTDTLLKRLRTKAQGAAAWGGDMLDAADELDRLTARLAQAEALLREQVARCSTRDGRGGWPERGELIPFAPCMDCGRARAFLAASGEQKSSQGTDHTSCA